MPEAFSFLKDLADSMSTPPFIVPAMAKKRGIAIKRWLPKPMGYQMTIRLIRQVFRQIGLQNVKVDDLTFNTCRRFLPTLGNVLGLTRHEAQAVGNWVEDPCMGSGQKLGLIGASHVSSL